MFFRNLIYLLATAAFYVLPAQEKLQFHFGSRIDQGFEWPYAQVNDTISAQFHEYSSSFEASLVIEKPLYKNIKTRIGLGYRTGSNSLAIRKFLNNSSPTNYSEVYQLFNFYEIRAIADLRIKLLKKIYGFGGVDGSFRFKKKDARFIFLASDKNYWSNQELDQVDEGTDIFRDFVLAYRLGIGARPVKRVGLELLITRYLSIPTKGSVLLYEKTVKPVSTYAMATGKLVYYFNLGKKDQTAKVDDL